jgi:hypothetical protein
MCCMREEAEMWRVEVEGWGSVGWGSVGGGWKDWRLATATSWTGEERRSEEMV